MMTLCFDVLQALQGRTLVTAESCTGGMIGAALTAIPGSSNVYKGGIISYTNEVKNKILGVENALLERYGAVSEQVAVAMAVGARKALCADVSVSVTGLAGPGGDASGNPVGTVYIGYADAERAYAKGFLFTGDRQTIRSAAVKAALEMVLSENR